MKKVLISLLAYITIGFLPEYLRTFGINDWVSTVGTHNLKELILLVTIYIFVKPTEINIRSILMIAIVAQGIKCINYVSFYSVNINYEAVQMVCFCVFFVLLLYNSAKKYNHESDEINPENITLCFWRPEKKLTIIPTLIGYGIGGLSIYAFGNLWGFEWDKSEYTSRSGKSTRSIQKKYITIDTGIKANPKHAEILNDLVGSKARKASSFYIRCRCIAVLKPFLKSLGSHYEPKLFELLPSLYSIKIIGKKCLKN